MHVIFKGKGTLVQDKNDILSGGPIMSIYIVYKTSPRTINFNFVFRGCLFGAIKIPNTTNSDLINGNILVMVYDLIQQVILHIQMEETVKMLLFLELTWVILYV